MKGGIEVKSRSAHIVPKDREWIVFNPEGKQAGVFPTQKEAVEEATGIVKSARIGQVVVHRKDGTYSIAYRRGLPELHRTRDRSSIGRKNIKKAVSAVIRTRLLGE